jgi:hypothetical protein
MCSSNVQDSIAPQTYAGRMNEPRVCQSSINVPPIARRSNLQSERPGGKFTAPDSSSVEWPSHSDDLLVSFASTGGAWSCEVALELLRQSNGQPISKLARWIVSDQIVRFVQRHRWFIPAFQFSLPEMVPRPAVASVVAELRGAFDEQEIVSWFASPNSWLGGKRPAELVARKQGCVVQAARADRFIAAGN